MNIKFNINRKLFEIMNIKFNIMNIKLYRHNPYNNSFQFNGEFCYTNI